MNTLLVTISALLLVSGLWWGISQEWGDGGTNSNEEAAATAENATNEAIDESPKQATKPTVPNNRDNLVVDLSGQNLTAVPQSVFASTAVEELNLANNRLGGSLPGEIRLLQNLKILNLSNNQFTGVPAEVGQLRNLEVLDVSNNQLTGLPMELGNLKNLKTLNLKGNDYSVSDLENIKKGLPQSVIIETD